MKHTLTAKELDWINVQSPEANELAEFIRESGISRHDAEYVAQRYHRSGITVRKDYLLLLIQVPVFDRKLRLTQGVPVFFVIRDNQLFSLHYQPIIALDKIRADLEASEEWKEDAFDGGAAHLGLELTSLIYESSFRKLERLSKHIDIAEDAVFQGNERKMVEEVSLLTRDVMDFRKVIRPQLSLFKRLPNHRLIGEEVSTKWDRVNGQLLKMWDVLESMYESTRELSNTNFTLLQHKENELLRLLTIYSIIVIPMLILTDPFFNPRAVDSTIVDDIAFWSILGVLVVTLVIIFARVRGRKLI